ncbi:MAG: TIGR04149 family rSAM-modified RiPP [Prevotellaceae bacterium]|jgi:natural product precursor|nr:TIGR04149 family rSAM-modified RiPP [Prevotellaceae bacterium]
MKKVKLNALSMQYLKKKEMNALTGGRTCTCSCAYANSGGSSTTDNSQANFGIGSGGHSGSGDNCIITDGCNSTLNDCPNNMATWHLANASDS